MVLLLVVGYKAVAMVVVTTIFNVVTLFINLWYCKYRLSIKLRFARFKWNFLKEVSVYSFWIFLNAIMDRIYWSTGQFVLGIYRGAVAIAVYAVAIQLQSMYMLFSTAISGVFLPKVTAMVTRDNNEKTISDLFIRTGRLQYIVMAFILSAFIVLGKAFIRLWAGEGYEDAYYIGLMFFVPLTIPLIQNLGIVILQARNQMRFRSLLYVVIALASLGLSILLAKPYGGYGCAFATSLALLVGQVIIMNIYYQCKQHLDMIRFWKEIAKMSIVPAALVVAGLFVAHSALFHTVTVLKFCVCGLIFACLYGIAFWSFSMNREEKNLMIRPLMILTRK